MKVNIFRRTWMGDHNKKQKWSSAFKI